MQAQRRLAPFAVTGLLIVQKMQVKLTGPFTVQFFSNMRNKLGHLEWFFE